MKVALGAGGPFHIFDLARQMLRLGHLGQLYTGYPAWKVKGLPREYFRSHPLLMAPAQISSRLNQTRLYNRLNFAAITEFDRWMSRTLAPCDVLHTLSSFGMNTQKEAREKFGALLVCDRSSAHIKTQDELLREEFEHWKAPHHPIDPGIIERELEEYETADRIVVPSTFAHDTFLANGVPAEKLRLAPLGVDLSMFRSLPKKDDVFRVLYVGTLSLQKGIPYLLEAVHELRLPKFEVWLIGAVLPEARPFLENIGANVRCLGTLPRRKLLDYYSQGSVLVLPSIQDGFGMVMSQAMACGVPVIASTNTGGRDLFEDGKQGFIVPIRDSAAIRDGILRLYRERELQRDMARRAAESVKALGGWDQYGERVSQIYREGLEERSGSHGSASAAPSWRGTGRTLPPISVSVSVGGKFHAFHLVEQLANRGWLREFLTTFFSPRRNASGMQIPQELVRTNVLPELISRIPALFFEPSRGHWNFRKGEAFDLWSASKLKPCDIFIGWSGFSLRTMRKAQSFGATVILVRGSAHILTQKRLLDEEGFRFGQNHSEVDSLTVEKELQEYQEADYIAMPSQFCRRSFLEQGLPAEKLLVWPLAADIRRFSPPPQPRTDAPFRVLYVGEVSMQKGIYYLLEAFHRVSIPGKELILVGQVKPSLLPLLEKQPSNVRAVGVVRFPGVEKYYHQASIFVLPSIQDGFGQVVMQAMATAMPAIVSTNAGASEAVKPGENGMLFTARNIDELAFCIETLYRYPDLRRKMGEAARETAVKYTWDEYGKIVEASLLEIVAKRGQKNERHGATP